MTKIIALVFSVFAFAFTQTVLAGAVGPWVGNLTPLGSVAYYGGSNYGKAQSAMGAGSRWNPDVLASTQNGVSVVQNVSLPVGAGVAKTSLAGAIGPLQVLATMGAVLGSPAIAIVSSVVLLPGVLDWLLKADVRPATTPGAQNYEAKDQNACTVGPCYEYTGEGEVWTKSIKDACFQIKYKYGRPVVEWRNQRGGGGPACEIGVAVNGTIDYTWYGIGVRSIAPAPAAWVPASYESFQNRLSGIPVTPQLINSLIDAGYTFPLDGPSVTGPAIVSAPPVVSTSTTTNAAGDNITTTTTNSTVSNQTYGSGTDPSTGKTAASVTSSTTTTTTTNVVNNTTNQTISNTVTVDKKPDSAVIDKLTLEEKVSSTDTPLPAQPKLYKQKYPDGLAGVWKTQRDLMVATPLFSLAKGLMPAVAMSGTCPKMPVNLTFASWANYGVKDVAPPCQVWDWGKAIIIVSALLLARRLIFGG